MADEWTILRKIERQIDILPWKDTPTKTSSNGKVYELNKTKVAVILGFTVINPDNSLLCFPSFTVWRARDINTRQD